MGPIMANHLPSRVQQLVSFGVSSPKYYLRRQDNVNSSEKGRYASKDNIVTDDGWQDDQGLCFPCKLQA